MTLICIQSMYSCDIPWKIPSYKVSSKTFREFVLTNQVYSFSVAVNAPRLTILKRLVVLALLVGELCSASDDMFPEPSKIAALTSFLIVCMSRSSKPSKGRRFLSVVLEVALP